MRPKKHETTKEGDLFRARLDQIIMCGCPRRCKRSLNGSAMIGCGHV
jgi:hypothetical protein